MYPVSRWQPTTKAFGAALPIELPTRLILSFIYPVSRWQPTPKAFGAALPIELPNRLVLSFYLSSFSMATNPEGVRGCSTDLATEPFSSFFLFIQFLDGNQPRKLSGLLYRLSYRPA